MVAPPSSHSLRPYAIVGALSLNAYGYQRTPSDVNVLLRREDLESFKGGQKASRMSATSSPMAPRLRFISST